jgi:hypothetical protein
VLLFIHWVCAAGYYAPQRAMAAMQRRGTSTEALMQLASLLRRLASESGAAADLKEWTRSTAVFISNSLYHTNSTRNDLHPVMPKDQLLWLLNTSLVKGLQLLASGASPLSAAAAAAPVPIAEAALPVLQTDTIDIFLSLAFSAHMLLKGAVKADPVNQETIDGMLASIHTSGE